MKPIIWIRLFICCAVVGPFRAVEARNVRSVLQEEEILRFDRTVLDVGTLTEDDAPQTYRFTCTNVSGKTVKLTCVKTTCGCTAADVRMGEILPGETRVIALTYTPKNHPGTIDTNAFIYLASSDSLPAARLTLRGNVLPGADEWARYPYAMGKLRLRNKIGWNFAKWLLESVFRNEFCAVTAATNHYACRLPSFRHSLLSVRNRK